LTTRQPVVNRATALSVSKRTVRGQKLWEARVRHVRIRQLALAIGGIAVLLTACSGGSHKNKIAGLTANEHGTKDVTGMTSLEVEADNFYFAPTVLKGAPGQHLTLTIKNSSGTDHNFTL